MHHEAGETARLEQAHDQIAAEIPAREEVEPTDAEIRADMVQYAAARVRIWSLDEVEPMDAEIRANMFQYAAARARPLGNPVQSTAEGAGGTTWGDVPTTKPPAVVSELTPSQMPETPSILVWGRGSPSGTSCRRFATGKFVSRESGSRH